MSKHLRVLHLSDLHIGQDTGPNAWRVERVMGEAWKKNLADIRAEGPIDLVCFTGDLAFSGKPAQYADAARLIETLLQSIDCPRERFFCVPGNHDIDRDVAQGVWTELRALLAYDPAGLSRWMAGGRPPPRCVPEWRDGLLARQQAYRDFLKAAGLQHLLPGEADNPHPTLGYRRTLKIGAAAPLHIIGFDTAWLAGDNHDAGKLSLSDDQMGRLLHDAEGHRLPGWSIGLAHHPLTDLADAREAQRRLGEYGLGLLLHGHQHDPVVERWADPQAGLQFFASGCLYEHTRYPNGLLVIDLELPEAQPLRPKQVWARRWSHRRAEWIDDDELYRGTRNGRLLLSTDPPPPTPTPGQFIGRDAERDQLRAALLPAASGAVTRPTVICCAIAGMPGVGKTRLAEEFVAHDWRKALGLPAGTPLPDLCARIALLPDDRRDAEALASALLAAYGRTAQAGQAVAGLRGLLSSGPGGQRLLLIENVDGPAQAAAVAALAAQLPGCAILATARYRDLAGGVWRPVAVDPLPQPQAIALLRERMALGRRPHPLDEAQAIDLVERLGRLPLALHIAGSHLGRGTSPRRFAEQLEAQRLTLGPAAAGDAAHGSDAARAVIASAFALSWDLWCQGAGADPACREALVALAHGPAEGVGDALGAAIAALDAGRYADCTQEADALSLLDVEFIQQLGDAASQRRVRLHPLIAEFLRLQPSPDAAVVIERIGEWCAPHLQEGRGEAMAIAWAALRAESRALALWLARAPRLGDIASIERGFLYGISHGPYADWLQACARWAGVIETAAERGSLRLAEARLALHAGYPVRSESAAWAALQIFQDAQMTRDAAIAYGQIADILWSRGELEEALRIRREEELPVYERLGDVHSRAMAQGKIADILVARGELEEALRIRQEEIPVYEQLGDVRTLAITHGQIANILHMRGEFEEALRIRLEDELPVYDRLGDVRSRTITQGNIADIFEARGKLEEALRIRREEELPIYERLGDVRSVAITYGKIADILQARGQLKEALRIRRQDEIPVYQRLGDVREFALAQGKIAYILQEQGELQEALRIRREEQMPIYERLGDVQLLLVGRANLAITLLRLGREGDKEEILDLLRQALDDAERLRLPEAQTILDLLVHAADPGTSSRP